MKDIQGSTMGKKRTKREKNFPRHVVTGVAVTSLAFGVLTNASGLENLFEPHNYKQFEKQFKNKNSDYAAGKGKDTDLADKNHKKQKNSGDNLSEALKLAQQTQTGANNSQLNLAVHTQNTNNTTKNPNAVSISDTNGKDEISTNPSDSTNDSSSDDTKNPSSDSDDSSNNNSSSDTTNSTTPSDDSNNSQDSSSDSSDSKDHESKPDDSSNSDTTTDWEKEQLTRKDSEETKYGKITKLEAVFTKNEYSLGAKFSAEDATVTGTFIKNGTTYIRELPYGGEDGYDISFSTNKTGTLSAIFRFGGLTTRSSYNVSENHVVVNFCVIYNGDYYAAQFKGDIFDFLTEDVQSYLTSLNKIPYTYPYGGTSIDLTDMHSRMIAYLLNTQTKESVVKLEGSYPNINFLEESSDGYLKTMLEGFRFVTNKQLIDSKSYIYYPADKDSWNYSINSKQIADIVVTVPDEFKIKRETQSENDWKSYRGDQVLEQYVGKDQNLSVPMGVTKVKFVAKPSNADVTTLTLPESVQQIDQASIADYLPDLKEYAYADPNDQRAVNAVDYKIIDGVLYSSDGTTLLSVPPGRTKKLVIPSTVTTLAKDCFKNVSLNQIYFEDASAPVVLGDTGYHGTIVVPASDYDLTCKKYMFAFAKECSNIEFMSSNDKTSKYSYDETTNTICQKDDATILCAIPEDAKGLYNVDSKYETIDSGAFYGNSSITDIELGNNIKYLKKDSLVFSNKIASISSKYYGLKIDSHIFGDSLEHAKAGELKFYVNATDYEKYLEQWKELLDPVYGNGTTQNLIALNDKNIIYEDGAKYQKYMDGSQTRYRLLQVYETDKTAFKVKDGTTEITSTAFENCEKLEILYLPSTLQSFDVDILANCNVLETVINLSTDVSISDPDISVFQIGTDYQDFVYEDGVVYGKSLDNTYTLLNVPTDFKGILNVKNNTKKLYDKAFYHCNAITTVTVSDPASLIEIGTSCFEGNQALDNCDLSQFTNLKLLGNSAFKDCTKLTSIKLPDQLQTLEDQTFYGCVDLQTVEATGILSIKDEVFAECLALEDTKGFNNLQTMGDRAFYDCKTLQKTTLPESMTKVGEECFENCVSLRSASLNGSLSAISRYCFYGCEKLADLSISETQQHALKVIGAEAFAECKNLKNPDFTDFTSLTQLGEGAFQNCTELVSMKLPKTIEQLPADCFSGCSNLSALQLNSEKAVTLDPAVFGDTISHYLHILVPEESIDLYKESYQQSLDSSYGDGTTNKVLSVIDPNTEYLKGVQYELTENGRILKSVSEDYEGEFTVLEDTIKIDADAFKNCSKLTKLTIPQDTTLELGDRCFKDCTGLEEVIIYGNIPNWDDETFMGCTSLKKVTIGYSVSNIPRIGTRAFKGCTGLNDNSAIVIGAHVNTIGKEAFMNCTNLPAVGFTINSTNGDARKFLQIIEDSAFENCQKLSTLLTSTFSSVTTLGDYVFKGCTSLKQPSLSQSVTTIGKGCFMNCSNLLYVSFYGAVKEFPENCFKNCPKLIRTGGTALAFSSLKRIGDGAYEGCASLTSSSSWYLERYANLEEIGDHAFKDCTNLADSTLSATVNKIGTHAFDGCTNMKSLTFKGTTPPVIGVFSPDTMNVDFLIKVPDSQQSGDSVYKDYFNQLNAALGSEDQVYPILDSISDGAKNRNTPAKAEEVTETNNEDNSDNNKETNE